MCNSRDEVVGVQACQRYPQEPRTEPFAFAEQHPLRTKNSVTLHCHGVLTPPTPFFLFRVFCVSVEMKFKSYKYIYIYVYIRFSPLYLPLPCPVSLSTSLQLYIFDIKLLSIIIIVVWYIYIHSRQQQKNISFPFCNSIFLQSEPVSLTTKTSFIKQTIVLFKAGHPPI